MKLTTTAILLLTLTIVGFTCRPASAQIQLGGLVDVEVRKAGDDSSPYVNQSPVNGKWTVYTPYLRLFADGIISDKWFVSAVLQADYYDGRHLSQAFFSVINANWMPYDDSDLMVTIGRFVTPYGTYAERILSSENPFVHLPLTHASGLPVNKMRGFLSDDVDYGEITGLTMVYQRMYAQGLSISNRVGQTDWLSYTLAATLAPASSHFEVGEHNMPAFTGRLTLHPAVWGRIGFSFSTGSFMKRGPANLAVSDSDLSSYTQTLLGTDLQFSYRYYTFQAEYNWSRWNAPYIDNLGVVTDDNLEAPVQHLAAEAIVNLPFWAGSHLAIRYETLLSGDRSSDTGSYYSNANVWTYDRERIETVAGYKLSRNALLKLSYLYSADSGPGLDDDVVALQLSLGF